MAYRRPETGPVAEAGMGLSPAVFAAAIQLADSAFPSGRYTLSHGLESFVQAGTITAGSGVNALYALLSDQLEHSIAPTDGTALAWAHRSVPDPPSGAYDEQLAAEVDRRLTSVKLSREAREASARLGRGILSTVRGSFAGPVLNAYGRSVREGAVPGNGAVVMGLLTAELGIPLLHAVTAELYGFAAGWLNAALRLGVADHRLAQLVLYRCGSVMDRAARQACETGLDDMAGCAPLADTMSMRHERATLRLFSS